jgi:hypothetical protein
VVQKIKEEIAEMSLCSLEGLIMNFILFYFDDLKLPSFSVASLSTRLC